MAREFIAFIVLQDMLDKYTFLPVIAHLFKSKLVGPNELSFPESIGYTNNMGKYPYESEIVPPWVSCSDEARSSG